MTDEISCWTRHIDREVRAACRGYQSGNLQPVMDAYSALAYLCKKGLVDEKYLKVAHGQMLYIFVNRFNTQMRYEDYPLAFELEKRWFQK